LALLAALGCLAGAGRAEQGQPAPVNPFQAKPSATGARTGVVVLNDGQRLEGEVSSTRDRPLRFKDERTGETYEWTLDKILRIAQDGKETIEPDWRWKEAGSDVKVFTGYYYRHADLKVTVVLTSGETHTGHWRTGAPIHVRTGGDARKFLLYNEVKNVEKKTKDKDNVPPLTYVREVVFQPEQEGN
jgi:hypothetical protein